MQNSDVNDEKLLLSRTAEGDQLAFTQLFDTYHHTLGNFVFGIIKSKEVAEEVVLDTFLKIWMTREALSEVRNFKAYLFTLSRNAAISALRKVIRERTQQATWLAEQTSEPDAKEENKENYLGLVDEAIRQLSPQRKQIYLLSREKGMKYEDIAKQMGISRFTVRAHIQQAVASIIEFLKAHIQNGLLLISIVLKIF